MACSPSRTPEGLRRFDRRGTRGGGTSPHIPAGIFRLRAQSSISLLGRKRLGGNGQRSAGARAGTAFGRGLSEPYRSRYGVGGGELANVESGVDSGGPPGEVSARMNRRGDANRCCCVYSPCSFTLAPRNI